MLIDGIDLQEGSEARNLTVISGVADPSLTPNDGELFYRSDLPEFRVRINGTWEGMATISALLAHTHVLSNLTDVILGSPPTLNDVLTFDGTNWINSPIQSLTWGNITGTLSNQVDLQSALDTKTNQTLFDIHLSGTGSPALNHSAVDIINVPSGSPGIGATNVQSALDELNVEKEPVILPKNTGFNLSLGTTAGTVSEGNHLHTGVYELANINIQSHILDVTTNPHAVTKALVGLGNVDNTSDINKPISTLTQSALDGKAALAHNHPANVITNVPAGNISAADVQSALNELDNEKAGLSLANAFTANQTILKDNPTLILQDTTGAASPNIVFNDSLGNIRVRFQYNEAVANPAGTWQRILVQDTSGVGKSQIVAYESGRVLLQNGIAAASLDILADGSITTTVPVNKNVNFNVSGSGQVLVNGNGLALLNQANTFTAEQTFSGGVRQLRVDGSVATLAMNDTSQAVDQRRIEVRNVATTFEIRTVNDAETAEINKLLILSRNAQTLLTNSGDITYGGQSLARVGTANNFTQNQTISHTAPSLFLNETDTVDQNVRLHVGGGTFLITTTTDGGVNTLDTLQIFPNAKKLVLGPSDITFDGTSLVNSYAPLNINTQAGGAYTLVLSDAGKYIRMTSASSNGVTVPPNSAVSFAIGTEIIVRMAGSGQTSIVAGTGVTINTSGTLNIAAQHDSISLVKITTDVWDLMGAIA